MCISVFSPTRFSDQFYLVTMWVFLSFGFFSLVGDVLVLAANHFMNDVPGFIRRIVCLIVFCELFNTIFLMWGMTTVLRYLVYMHVALKHRNKIFERNHIQFERNLLLEPLRMLSRIWINFLEVEKVQRKTTDFLFTTCQFFNENWISEIMNKEQFN